MSTLCCLTSCWSQALIPRWHYEVDLLLGSRSSPACLNQSHFSSGRLCLDLGQWISLRAGWTLWKLNELAEGGGNRASSAEAGREMYEWLQSGEHQANQNKEEICEPIAESFSSLPPASPWLLLLSVTRSLCLPAPLNNLFHWVSVSLTTRLTGWLCIRGC